MSNAVLQSIFLAFASVIWFTPALRAQTSLVSTGAVWSYLDNGSDQGTDWRSLSFDDGSWSNGLARLGYGGIGEVTLIKGGPAANRYVTTYFRNAFPAPNPAVFSNLVVRLVRDDGGIVYLNGVEIFRSNMPDDPVDYLTYAANCVSFLPLISLARRFMAEPLRPMRALINAMLNWAARLLFNNTADNMATPCSVNT